MMLINTLVFRSWFTVGWRLGAGRLEQGPGCRLNQLDATYHFIVLLIGSSCFGHYCVHHQELRTVMLITTLVVSFLVCCRLEVKCG